LDSREENIRHKVSRYWKEGKQNILQKDIRTRTEGQQKHGLKNSRILVKRTAEYWQDRQNIGQQGRLLDRRSAEYWTEGQQNILQKDIRILE
jgi:hypothetical protein